MTGQPPEDSSQYEDPLTPTAQYSYGNYGEPRYREAPQYQEGQYQEGQGQYRDTAQFESPQFDAPQYQETPHFQPTPQFHPAQPDAEARYRSQGSEGEGYGAEGGEYGAEGTGYGALGGGYGAAGGAAQTPPPPVPPTPPGPAGRPSSGGGASRGFLGALFDFSFSSFVTPRIIKALYVLFVLAAAAASLIFIVVSFRISALFGIFTLLILAPIGFLLWVAFYRVILEFYMVTFRMAEDIRDLRDRYRELH